MKSILHLSLIFLLFTLLGFAQAGSLDTSFNPIDLGFGNGDGANNDVNSVVVQPDGKILMVGVFDLYNGTTQKYISRLNADGSIDTSFNVSGSGANNTINVVALQPDGKILIGGYFTYYNHTARNNIVRLNANGSLDTSFNQVNGAGGVIYSMALQADGKILIGGDFTNYSGISRNRIARLNSDGSLDTSFNPGTGTDRKVDSIGVQPDGKILIGGNFTTYSDISRNRIARLNSDGSLDTTFNPGNGGCINTFALQPDGKILIGFYISCNIASNVNRIARLNTDGSLDASFSSGSGANNNIYAFSIQSDGKMIIGGDFTNYNGTSCNRVARLNADGSLDVNFDTGSGADLNVFSVVVQADGKVLIGGKFSTYNGATRNRITRLNADGNIDASFNPGTGSNNTINAVSLQPDGKILIGGSFTSYNGTVQNKMARLNANGNLDTSFNLGISINDNINAIALQPDGKILIGGNFYTNDYTLRCFTRLNADGSLDATFNPGGAGARGVIYSIALQPDGKILIGGGVYSYNGQARNMIARLNSDGSLDMSFNPNIGSNGIYNPDFPPGVYSIVPQPDGKILIGGINLSDSSSQRFFSRLNADGSLDTTFNPGGTGANLYVYSIALQPDGKILIGGLFTYYNGIMSNRITRLNADGSLDTSFNATGTGVNNQVKTIVLQPDGKILIGGQFTNFNNTSRMYIARLIPNGYLDMGFNTGSGFNNPFVYSMALQPDGRILVGGGFTSYNGIGRNRMARIKGWTDLGTADNLPAQYSISIFPNPTTSTLNIQTPNYQPADQLSVYDLTGKLIFTQNQPNMQVEVGPLAAGMYLLEVVQGEDKVVVKFVKK